MTLLVRRTLILAGTAVLIAVAAIGTVRATATTATTALIEAPSAALAAAPATGAPTVETGLGIDLDNAIGDDLDAILAADQKTPAATAANPRGQLRRLAAWRRLVHATVVVDLKQGGLTTVQLDHGTISAVGATTLTIAETGGGSMTVALGDETRVRRNGEKAAVADLKSGDEVFVLSKVQADRTEAYLVVVPKA
jgi:hypothetical protein